MFLHREIYERTNGFDENIFLYGEEGEWQYRMLKEGYSCFLIPQPKIIHLEGKSMKESPTKTAVKWKSHFYILKKHMWYPTYFLARLYYGALSVIFLRSRNVRQEKSCYKNTIFCGVACYY